MIDVPAKNILIALILHNEHLILRKSNQIALALKPYPKDLAQIAINLEIVSLWLVFRIWFYWTGQ